MKMFTKLIGSVLMLLFISALGLGQSQQVVNSAVDGIDNPAGTSTKIVLVQQIDINKISNYGGPSDAIIFDNGPLITHPTGGFGGAPASALQTVTGPMLTLYGYGSQQALNNRLADDFSVPAGSTWTLSTIKFFSYQTNSTTTSTITGVFVQIWSGNPSSGGTLLWGDITTNRLSSTAFSGIYRSIESALTASNRPIMDVIADVSTCPVLTTGTYWVDVCFTGSLTSGPWLPPVTIWNTGITGDAIQHLGSSSTWAPIVSGTAPNTYAQGIPFVIDGTASVPTCLDPSGQGVTNITLTSADLTWTSLSGLSDVEFGVAGFTPTGVPTDAGVTSPLSKSSLSAATSYSFYVRDDCGGGSYSSWIGPYTFSTFCGTCTGTPEGEPQLVNGSTLAGINGGCAYGDPLLTSPIALGDTYCGQSNSFINDLGGAARDNDYYYLDLNSPACQYWNITLTLQGNSLVNLILFDAGDMTCNISAVAAATTTSACEIATITAVVPSGNYYVVARVATATGNLWPAGSGPWQYTLTANGAPAGAPVLDPVPPAEIVVEVPPAGSASENLTIDNTGTYDLEYAASTTGAYSSVFGDNFDSYVAGVQLAGQSGGNWTTWGGTSGGADDGFVTNAQAFSPANSFVVTPNIDQVHLFGDLSSGVYKISFMNYITAGKSGYFNILSDFTFGTGGYWVVDMYFNVDGSIEVVANHTTILAPFTWTPGVWKKVEVVVDLDNDVAEAIYDGQSIYSWPWSEGGSAGTGPLIIDAIDLFGATADDEMYVDNFLIEVAGLDWLTLNGGLGVTGSVAPADPADIITVGINAGSNPVGEYNKTINLATNELCGAKNSYVINATMYLGYVIYGNIYYGDLGNTKPQVTTTSVTLTPGSTQNAGTGGSYRYRALADGAYTIIGTSGKAWAGLNAPDASFAQQYILGTRVLTNLQKRAADINLSGTIQSLDVTMLKRRILSQTYSSWVKPTEMVWDGPFLPGWHGVNPTWIQSGAPVTISGSNVNHNVRCLFTGDVNESATPVPNP